MATTPDPAQQAADRDHLAAIAESHPEARRILDAVAARPAVMVRGGRLNASAVARTLHVPKRVAYTAVAAMRSVRF